MLNLWMGSCPKEWKDSKLVIINPDAVFDFYFKDLSILRTDFADRLLRECSRSRGMIYSAGFITDNDVILPIQKASTGAKIVLLLLSIDCVCNWTLCGDNCNTFIAEIAETKDITMYSTRFLNPFKRAGNLSAVRLVNTDMVFTDERSFVNYVVENDIGIGEYIKW